jgi:hypothetical protein
MVRSSGAHQQRTEPTSRIILDTVPIRVCVCWIAASQSLAPACSGLGSKLLRRGNRNLRLKGRARARPDKFRSLTFECGARPWRAASRLVSTLVPSSAPRVSLGLVREAVANCGAWNWSASRKLNSRMLLSGKTQFDTYSQRVDGTYAWLNVLLVAVHDHRMRFIGHRPTPGSWRIA